MCCNHFTLPPKTGMELPKHIFFFDRCNVSLVFIFFNAPIYIAFEDPLRVVKPLAGRLVCRYSSKGQKLSLDLHNKLSNPNWRHCGWISITKNLICILFFKLYPQSAPAAVLHCSTYQISHTKRCGLVSTHWDLIDATSHNNNYI